MSLLSFGSIWIQDLLSDSTVAIHFLHRIGAVVVSIAIIFTATKIFLYYKNQPQLKRPAVMLVIALVLQITLAALTIWSQKAVIPTTAHVATGAFILANSLYLTLRTYQLLKPAGHSLKNPGLVEQPA